MPFGHPGQENYPARQVTLHSCSLIPSRLPTKHRLVQGLEKFESCLSEGQVRIQVLSSPEFWQNSTDNHRDGPHLFVHLDPA